MTVTFPKTVKEGYSCTPIRAALSGNLLYPLVRTGPVVPAHPGDDQEQFEAEREFVMDALCPACPSVMLLRARHP